MRREPHDRRLDGGHQRAEAPACTAPERKMSDDEIRLVIPAEEDFRPIVHLVTGGLASRLDVTYDDLEDIQVAVDAVLALRDDEGDLTVVLSAEPGIVRVSVGPFEPDVLHPAD